MPLRSLLVAVLCCLALPAWAATEVMPLQHRSAAELLPQAQALLGREGTVTAFEQKLVVTAEPARIDAVRQLLAQLDAPAARLLITVDTTDRRQAGLGSGRTITYDTQNRSGGVQQVQATDGQPALVQVGQSIPLTQERYDSYGVYGSSTEYRNVTQGFYVTATVIGENVRLHITTNNDRISDERQDVVDVQSSDTTLTGALGEWLLVAGHDPQSQAGQIAGSRQYATQRGEAMTVRLKVDRLP